MWYVIFVLASVGMGNIPEVRKKGKRRRLRQFQIHHKHYRYMGEESREDFLVLCASCHNTAHEIEKLASSRGGIWEEVYTLFKELTSWEYEKFTQNKEK